MNANTSGARLKQNDRKLFSFCQIIGFTLEFRMHINTLISFFFIFSGVTRLCAEAVQCHQTVCRVSALSLRPFFGGLVCGRARVFGTHVVLLCVGVGMGYALRRRKESTLLAK